jgi:hypothetical protein
MLSEVGDYVMSLSCFITISYLIYEKYKIREGYLLHSGDPNRMWFRFRLASG